MALPDPDKVIQELNRRFAAPLPEFYNRRIIFWYDEDRDFEEKIQSGEIELANAKLITLDDTNNFEVKKLLTHDDKISNYCVYCPIMYPDEKNWLLPIQLYSEEFRADPGKGTPRQGGQSRPEDYGSRAAHEGCYGGSLRRKEDRSESAHPHGTSCRNRSGTERHLPVASQIQCGQGLLADGGAGDRLSRGKVGSRQAFLPYSDDCCDTHYADG